MKKFTIKNFISELLATLAFLWMLWILLSLLDIAAHNKSDFIYQSWNFFTLLF